MNRNDVVIYKDGDLEVEVQINSEEDTVWLTLNQIAELFERDKSSISRHISNIYKNGELDRSSTVAKNATVQNEGGRNIERSLDYYNLDLILSVGYRVNSKRGIAFRRWASSVLKDYMLKGYAINEKRLKSLNKTVEIQSRIIASALELESDDVYKVVNEYTKALDLLDDYDHQCLSRPNGSDTLYRLSYEEVRKLIDSMKFNSDVFGVEKEKGKLNGILEAVYQNVFGTEVYPSIEEKAANLLYFLIKDHPFADGCKRIGASVFLEFLNKNNALIRNGKQVISDSALVAITLMVAESRPEEKETMVTLIMNFLGGNE
ncbi:MAG: RhuM family protein [Erysipelotrichaceae bacterium]|nr:RhuM family protein [Erysipelotrichaceae bacterium]